MRSNGNENESSNIYISNLISSSPTGTAYGTALPMRICTWNVNGWKPTAKNIELRYGSLQKFFEHLQLDIICIQETKVMAEAIPHGLRHVPGYESFWTCSSKKKGYSGCATYVKLDRSAVSAQDDSSLDGDYELKCEGRYIATHHGETVIVNVYAPNAGGSPERPRLQYKLSWFAALRDGLEKLRRSGKRVILVGDLNIPRSRKDVSGEIEWEGLYTPELQEVSLINCMATELVDAWRAKNEDVSDVFTVWDERTNARATNRGLRIDYVLISPELQEKVVDCQVNLDIPQKWSDHAPVIVGLREMPTHDMSCPPPPCSMSSRGMPKNGLKSLFNKRMEAESRKQQPALATEAPLREGHERPTADASSDHPGASHAVAVCQTTAADQHGTSIPKPVSTKKGCSEKQAIAQNDLLTFRSAVRDSSESHGGKQTQKDASTELPQKRTLGSSTASQKQGKAQTTVTGYFSRRPQ